MKLLLKSASYPLFVLAISSIAVVFVYLFVPHEWSESYFGGRLVLFVSKFVPAMKGLMEILPADKTYLNIIGAVIWAMSPLFFLLGVISVFCPDSRKNIKTAAEVRLKILDGVYLVLGMPILLGTFVYFSFFRVWDGGGHSKFGFWLNFVSDNIFIQVITWASVSLGPYLFAAFSTSLIYLLVIKFRGK